jgi:hypothetical protein
MSLPLFQGSRRDVADVVCACVSLVILLGWRGVTRMLDVVTGCIRPLGRTYLKTAAVHDRARLECLR